MTEEAEETVTGLCREYIETKEEAEKALKEGRDAPQFSRLSSKAEGILRRIPSAKRK